MCMQNIEHTRKFSSSVFEILDRLSFRCLMLFRIGPWYCYQCEGRSLYLRQPNRRAPTFNRERSRSDFINQSTPDLDTAEAIGNFIKSDQSLVMRHKRTRRYSAKFRDAAVERLLGETSSISQLKTELDVSEQDLIGWIADLVSRQQDRIRSIIQSPVRIPGEITGRGKNCFGILAKLGSRFQR